VYNAITEQDGLSAWWTKTKTEGKVGSTASFFFGQNEEHQVVMEITDLVKNESVSWKCIDGPWVNTDMFLFQIQADERGSVLQFSHSGWPEADEFYMHCNSKWGFFLTVSLKNLLETGKGQPHPNDPNI
jgi:uncharacterized protein YndB with AHSA1/START domain